MSSTCYVFKMLIMLLSKVGSFIEIIISLIWIGKVSLYVIKYLIGEVLWESLNFHWITKVCISVLIKCLKYFNLSKLHMEKILPKYNIFFITLDSSDILFSPNLKKLLLEKRLNNTNAYFYKIKKVYYTKKIKKVIDLILWNWKGHYSENKTKI